MSGIAACGGGCSGRAASPGSLSALESLAELGVDFREERLRQTDEVGLGQLDFISDLKLQDS